MNGLKIIFYKSIFITACLILNNSFADEAVTSTLKETATGAAVSGAAGYGAKKAIESSASASGMFNSLKSKLDTPTGIMIVSGIGGFNSFTLMQAAADQVDESNNNIRKIETLMQTFKDSWVNHCPNGRNDLKEPMCYCYLENGSKNSNRTNSQTCVDLWAKNTATITVTPDTESSTASANDPTGCLTTSGAFDENCKCKKFIDSKGNNACKKVSSLVALNNNAFTTSYLKNSGANNLAEAANALASGSIGMGSLNTNSMAMRNAFQKDLNKSLVAQLNQNPNNKGFKGFNNANEVQNAQNSLFSKKAMDQMSGNQSSLFASMGLNPNPTLAKAIRDVEAKAGVELSGTGKGVSKKEDNKNLNMNFGDSSSGSSSGQNNVDFGETEKKYKYKNSDISKDSGASLFEIISNRYLESALPKLFIEEKPN